MSVFSYSSKLAYPVRRRYPTRPILAVTSAPSVSPPAPHGAQSPRSTGTGTPWTPPNAPGTRSLPPASCPPQRRQITPGRVSAVCQALYTHTRSDSVDGNQKLQGEGECLAMLAGQGRDERADGRAGSWARSV